MRPSILFLATAVAMVLFSCSKSSSDNKPEPKELPDGVTDIAAANSQAVGLETAETANCYILNSAGKYAFPADVRGNGVSAAGLDAHIDGVASASIVWDEGNILRDVSIITGHSGRPWIVVETPSTFAHGNALVAAKDEAGIIVWSWHIWATAYRPGEDKTIGSTANGCWSFIPVDLGMTTTDDSSCMLYQWGRKDPFRCQTPGQITGLPSNIENTIKYPERFYAPSTSIYCNGGDVSLWNPDNSPETTAKTMLDPCPPGYFVAPYQAAKLMIQYGVDSCEPSAEVVLRSGTTVKFHPTIHSGELRSDRDFYWQHSYWQPDNVAAPGRKGSAVIDKNGTSWTANNLGGFGLGLPVRAARKAQFRAAFMGDSITEFWGGSQEDSEYEERRGDAGFFVSNAFLNKGIAGQTTAQMLARFDDDIVANNPIKVVILAGTNDLAGNDNEGNPRSSGHILANISAMARKALDGGAKEVLLCSVLPVSQYNWRPAIEPMPLIRDLNDKIKAYCEATPGCTYVDYFSAWLNEEGTGAKAGLTYDEVHPTRTGCAVLEEIILKYL